MLNPYKFLEGLSRWLSDTLPAEIPDRANMLRKMTQPSQAKVADMISDFRGLYARVAHKLDVSPSLVSRVASGGRRSPEIETALREELKTFKDKLDKYL
jgi:transcriptional regulator with XRE-family HTH domain